MSNLENLMEINYAFCSGDVDYYGKSIKAGNEGGALCRKGRSGVIGSWS
jgi:hypothetical protein